MCACPSKPEDKLEAKAAFENSRAERTGSTLCPQEERTHIRTLRKTRRSLQSILIVCNVLFVLWSSVTITLWIVISPLPLPSLGFSSRGPVDGTRPPSK